MVNKEKTSIKKFGPTPSYYIAIPAQIWKDDRFPLNLKSKNKAIDIEIVGKTLVIKEA